MGRIIFTLSEIMGRHRIKQNELAARAGVRPAAIHALYHGQRQLVDLFQLAAILDALNEMTGQDYQVSDLIQYRR